MSRLKREGNPPSGQLASPVPQAWDPSINDFREITGQNLGGGRFGTDGVQWGKTASGLFMPIRVTNDGVQEVQLSGPITEVVKVVDALAITTSATSYITLPFSLTRYRDWDLFVTNTLDTECRVGFTGSPVSNSIHVVTESGEVRTYNPGETYNAVNYKVNGTMRDVRLSTLPMATEIPDHAEYKKLSAFIKNIAIRSHTDPTAGAITITLVGWY